MKRFSLAPFAAAVALILPGSAGAATQVGTTFTPPVSNCTSGSTVLQSAYATPFAGVITSWSFRANATPPRIKFKVGRGPFYGIFYGVGESSIQSPATNSLNTYPVRIPVFAGDLIGFYVDTNGDCGQSASGYSWYSSAGDLPPGGTQVFETEPFGFQFDLSAMLEKDADKDGFGDETQDQCPTDAATQGPCPTGAATSTGQRAAAVRKCKKRFPKGPRRTKCIKKAKRLPV